MDTRSFVQSRVFYIIEWKISIVLIPRMLFHQRDIILYSKRYDTIVVAQFANARINFLTKNFVIQKLEERREEGGGGGGKLMIKSLS